MKAHQKLVREKKAKQEGYEQYNHINKNLALSVVKSVSKVEASKIILDYEWLGTMGTSQFAYGIYFDNVIGGVVCFGYLVAMGGYHRYVGEKYAKKGAIIQLCRGACAHWTPVGAASKLISQALRFARDLEYKCVIAYADEDAGEIGTVYQATNWYYCGKGTVKHFDLYKEGKVLLNDRDYYKRYKICDLDNVAATLGATVKWRNPKHRYFYLLGSKKEKKEMLGHLSQFIKSYPKREIAGEVSRRDTEPPSSGVVQSHTPAPTKESTMIEGEQYLYVDVECYGCDRLVALSYSTMIDGRTFCHRCTLEYKCPTCRKATQVSNLKDKLSMKEAQISGMCQACQDSVFKDKTNE